MEEKAIFNNVYGYFAEFVNTLILANLKKLNKKTLEKSFDIYKTSLVNYYGISSNLINLVEKRGIYSLKINKKIVPEKRLKKSLEWLQYNGILIEYLKKIGIPRKFLESDLVIERNMNFLKKYEEYQGFRLLTNMKIRIKLAKQVNNAIKKRNIKTATDLTNVLEQNVWLKTQFDNFLKHYYNNNKEMGSWVKTPSLTSNNINSLVDAIKNHQNAIKPGCWAIKYDKNNKCLVKDLSCNETIIPSAQETNTNLCEPLDCKKCCKNQKNCELVCSNTGGSVLVPADTVLICIKNSNFWVAAQDYMNIFFDVPEIEVLNDDDDDDDDINDDINIIDNINNDNSSLKTSSNDVLKWVYIVIAMAALVWMIYLIYSKARL
jgi:hypothetical protein